VDVRVLDANGAAPAAAEVLVKPKRGREPEVVTRSSGGGFEVDLPRGAFRELRVAAVDHVEFGIPVLFPADVANAQVTVQLEANPRPETYDEVVIIGPFCEYEGRCEQTMERRDDGTFVWSGFVNEGAVEYQLYNVTTNGHTVNGTQSERYRYDGGGDFFSVVTATDGLIEVVFDPAAIPDYAPGGATVEWDGANAIQQEIARLYLARDRVAAAMQQAMAEAESSGEEGPVPDLDHARFLNDLKELILSDTHPAVRAAAVLIYLQSPLQAEPSGAFLDAVVEALPPDSPLWEEMPHVTFTLTRLLDDTSRQVFLDRLVAENPSAEVRGHALASLVYLARESGDEEAWRTGYERLSKEYGQVESIEPTIRYLDPDHPIRVGRPVPEFEVTLLDGTTFTHKDLQNHWTLLDFWAVWCGPCVGEMPVLHEAWERYHGTGLRIVSLSMDETPEAIAEFRAGTWSMPWMHAFLEGGFQHEAVRAFRVHGIPQPVLVGPDGMIAADPAHLRGELLVETLEEHLGSGTSNESK
jgi:thiol-disulfide isomerase/thioredoxin